MSCYTPSLRYLASTISLKNALLQSASGIIAEFKRKSPSKGWLNAHAEPLAVIPAYEQAGATALSVLTDSIFFGGHMPGYSKSPSSNSASNITQGLYFG